MLPFYVIILIGGCGFLIGFLLNIVVVHLPISIEREWYEQCNDLFYDLPKQHPPDRTTSDRKLLVIVTTGCLYLLVAAQIGTLWHTLAALVLVSSLIILAFIGEEHQLLPDLITLPLIYSGVFVNAFGLFASPIDSVIGGALGYLSLWFLNRINIVLVGKEAIGHGDFKVFAALGAWLGWKILLPVIVLLSISLIVEFVIRKLYTEEARKNIPTLATGPHWAISGIVNMIWGNKLLGVLIAFGSWLIGH